MASKFIMILAFLTLLVLGVLDVHYLGHYGDRYFQKKVQKTLIKANYNASANRPIRSSVDNGWVVLDGPIATEVERARVTAAINREVPGLRGITNNLRIPGEPICAKAVLEKLKDLVGTDESEAQVSYLVDSGCNTTLTGWVPTQSMKEAVGAVAASAPGVQKVVNNIEVGRPKKKLQDTLIEILRMQNIYFDFNKWTIRDESKPALDRVAEALKENPDYRVRIEGHTDSISTVEYNLHLSQKRAEAVRDALIERGIPADRLEAIGYGKSRPIATNNTPEGRADNRRIEFKVL